MSDSELDIARESALAFERATDARNEAAELEGRLLALESKVQALEQQAKQKSESRNLKQTHRSTLIVAIVSGAIALVTGVVLWFLQWSTSTKDAAVKQSTSAIDRKIAASRLSTESTYDNGFRDGAVKRQLEIDRLLAEKGLVIVPREVIHASPPPPPK